MIMGTAMKCVNDGRTHFKRNLVSMGSVLDLSFTRVNLTVKWDVKEIRIRESKHFSIILEIGISKDRGKGIGSLNQIMLEPDFDNIAYASSNEIDFSKMYSF